VNRRIVTDVGGDYHRGENRGGEVFEERNNNYHRRNNSGDNDPSTRHRNPRRRRSLSSAHTDHSDSTRVDLDNTIQEVENLFIPPQVGDNDFVGANVNCVNMLIGYSQQDSSKRN